MNKPAVSKQNCQKYTVQICRFWLVVTGSHYKKDMKTFHELVTDAIKHSTCPTQDHNSIAI